MLTKSTRETDQRVDDLAGGEQNPGFQEFMSSWARKLMIVLASDPGCAGDGPPGAIA